MTLSPESLQWVGTPWPDTLLAEWNYEANRPLIPDLVAPTSKRQLHWRCRFIQSHEWSATLQDRLDGAGCPTCSHLPATAETSVTELAPQALRFWDPQANHTHDPDQLRADSPTPVYWRCRTNPSHRWSAPVNLQVARIRDGMACPICSSGWTPDTLRLFLRSLADHLPGLSPAEQFTIYQQAGLLDERGPIKHTVTALLDGRLSREKAKAWADQATESLTDLLASLPSGSEEPTFRAESGVLTFRDELPTVSTKEILKTASAVSIPVDDHRAAEFLLRSAVNKIWAHAFENSQEALDALADPSTPSPYVQRVREVFLAEYQAARQLPIPEDYRFAIDGVPTNPNLMQRYVTSRLSLTKQLINLVGTGGGKTLAAVLASRHHGSPVTIITCPNNTIDTWMTAIRGAFPAAAIDTKTLTPRWPSNAPYRYLILNYETLQQPGIEPALIQLVKNHPDVGMLTIDEVHHAKVRTERILSLRRQRLMLLRQLAQDANASLAVLMSSATPIVNNLQEGRSMLELLRGHLLPHLDTTPTIENCIAFHQELVLCGIRWQPRYPITRRRHQITVDCTPWIPRILALPRHSTCLQLEQILTEARLTALAPLLAPHTLIYSLYTEGIIDAIRHTCETAGWKVGLYTGDNKDGLRQFLRKEIPLLLSSNVVGTGLDGLQHVCHRVILVTTPWTSVELTQLIGRLYRQGQRSPDIDIYFLVTTGIYKGTDWSWDLHKLTRINQKQTLADAAVDGLIPARHSLNPTQSYRHLHTWLHRLEQGTSYPQAAPDGSPHAERLTP